MWRVSKRVWYTSLGNVPIEPSIRVAGDNGTPIVYHYPESASGKRYLSSASKLWDMIEQINKDGGASNAQIQPTTPPGVSACSMK